MRLKDKVAIVTGGGVGIGKAYAHGLAQEGAKVVVADIQEAEAEKVAVDIKRAGGEAIAVPVDVTSAEKTQAMAAAALQQYGRIDILVNNAGLYSALKKKNFMEIDLDEWDRVMAVNLRGLFLCVKAVYPAMKRQRKGKIINGEDIRMAIRDGMREAPTQATTKLTEEVADEILAQVGETRDFWEAVYEPYSQNLISRDVVKLVVEKTRMTAGRGMPQIARQLKAITGDVNSDEEQRKRFFKFKNFLYKTVKI